MRGRCIALVEVHAHSGSGGEGMSHYDRVRSVREKSSPLQSSGSPSWRASA